MTMFITFKLLQALIGAWKKGLSTLTLRAALPDKLAIRFQGNAFDFINASIDDNELAHIPTLISYFATFFFGQQSSVQVFENLIEQFPKHKSHLYSCSIEQFHQMNNLVKQ